MRPIVSVFVLLLAAAAAAQPGSLDPAFGTDGRVTLSTGLDDGTSQVLALGDGGAIVAGVRGSEAVAYRLRADGTLDAAFGSDGVAAVDFGGSRSVVATAARLGDGSVLLVGATATADDEADAGVIAKLTPDGALDGAFGSGGIARVGGASTTGTLLVGLRAADDGRLLAVGSGRRGETTGVVSARFSADGQLDTTFGADGIAFAEVDAPLLLSGVVDADGAAVVAGGRDVPGSFLELDPIVVRVTAAGALDTSFGDGGVRSFETGSPLALVQGLLRDASGRLVATGLGLDFATGSGEMVVARLSSGGDLDAGFGAGGVVRTTANRAIAQGGRGALQADGKVLVAGVAGDLGGVNGDLVVVRLTAGGALDPTFGDGGIASVDFGQEEAGNALALVPTGEIVVGGTRFTPDGDPAGALAARLRNDGLPPTSSEPEALTPDPRRLVLDGPNPARGAVRLAVRLRADAHVRLSLFDARGAEVAVLLDGLRPAGQHTATADASALPAGVYVARLVTGGRGSEAVRVVVVQ